MSLFSSWGHHWRFWNLKVSAGSYETILKKRKKILRAQCWSETEETWVTATAMGFTSYLEQMTSSVLVFHLQN